MLLFLRSVFANNPARKAGFVFILLTPVCALVAQTAVTTYHNDNYRTGLNSTETVLTQANVNASQFGLLATVTVDAQVEAQPLMVPNVNITAGSNQGVHNVVYVATDNNTVYAIDAVAGTILLSRHIATPAPAPAGCRGNGNDLGITSTPVINTTSNTIYVMTYVKASPNPNYVLHALNLGSLRDQTAPVTVSASHTLTDGTTFNFNGLYQRQRPALLEANGNIYAGFGSFCDLFGANSRGWLLGWSATTLTPLGSNQLFDSLATSPDDFFLASIWMSGYGLAADDSGNVLFVTANADKTGTNYNGVTAIEESAIAVSPDLSTVVDLFTPSNWPSLDEHDLDFGSGGLMILPDQPGNTPHLAVAAGKNATMFLMNEDSLGGYSASSNNVLGSYQVGACWCGESYFVDTDGIARVVSSGATKAEVWKLATSPAPTLTLTKQSPALTTGQNAGFFTSVSSNGKKNPIIWALSRPVSKTSPNITLYAFNPDSSARTMSTLFSATSGTWPNYGGDSNQVPMIANGMVYVASYKQLEIFGLLPTAQKNALKGSNK
jgi:hypothetical protein